jgi:DNA uptake protein ComE-like DNA-binding protein
MMNSSCSRLQVSVLGLCASLLLFSGCTNNSTPSASTGDKSAAPAASSSSEAATTSASSAQGSKININTAPIAELDKLELPGTKPSLSERIQGARPYTKAEDLVTKKAISQEEYNLIKNLITTSDKK